MGQSLEGIRQSSPNPIVRFDTTSASTQKLERYQRTVMVDASSGANTVTLHLPTPEECSGDIFSIRVSGGTGGVNVHYNGTSESVSAGTTAETLTFISDGFRYSKVEDNAD